MTSWISTLPCTSTAGSYKTWKDPGYCMLGDWDWGYYVNYYELWSREDPDLDYIHIWTKWGLRTRQIDDVLSQVLPDGEWPGFSSFGGSQSFYLVAHSDLDHVVACVSLQSQHYYHFDGLLAFPSLLQARPVFDGAHPHRKILQPLQIRTYQLCTYASPSCHPVRHL